ncbi:MAG: ABC transporter ATP-binding protein [Methylacidiphilales bacterium]|nr:ABC transporter ATP-binding protein [Candidatus Methylacidiphilales bacterium]
MLLEFAHVSKTYAAPDGGAEVEVLRDVDFKLAAGEPVAIIGPSGSGKSTLLNIMGALDLPSTGTVRLNGRDLGGLTERELAAIRNREIGFIFQLHHLLPQCTVLENVLIPTLTGRTTDADYTRAERLLERVGLRQRLNHRPGQLSGGECQRVAVVRALINQPKLLLADEPTGSLDHAAAVNLGQLLLELNKEEGVALVLVTHSLELAGSLPRTMELRDGRWVV